MIMNSKLESYSPVTVIGAGAIGASWTALFLANGLEVRVNDISETLEEDVTKQLEQIKPTLKDLGYEVENLTQNLTFEKDLKKAVTGAKIIQENGPENVEFKQNLYAELEDYISEDAIVLSSSSSIPTSTIIEKMKDSSRVCIGHPFNPPHLIPLVEVSYGSNTDENVIEEVMDFYTQLGKKPVKIKKEVVGFVANRLQSALFQECIHLVLNDVVDPKDVDTIMEQSLGIRWASDGPFLSFLLGGGKHGFEGFMNHLGKQIPYIWKDLGHPELNEENTQKLIERVNEKYGSRNIDELEQERDAKEINVIRNLAEIRGEDSE
ncbi:hypothetical protein E2557_06470 [Staphylococcus petrasii]|uniref:6-phosphogluconate dehydrogenase, decarboxylating n=2 Tax=Staphylococcus petrasii TaxID=1276936 RepID=A0ABY2KTB4_9STAP|nr:hypothetical protein CD137_01410 [Staphylococcus petrasii]TGE12119.1 hypothetical protein E2557_06470 [Staphylococcus petrasii]TGE15873.1 hypothetical protein BJR09_10465 [Staphylococcus petrasii]